MLEALSPLDGRYEKSTEVLKSYFSEYALIKYRVKVEIKYFEFLSQLPIKQLKSVQKAALSVELNKIYETFSIADAQKIKDTEKVTNHDVKAVEYFVKEKLDTLNLEAYREFVHFGLTSQDINNTAFPMMIRDALSDVLWPQVDQLVLGIQQKAEEYKGIPMLARTHGQPASPTTLGKEMSVFVERLNDELTAMKSLNIKCKFGGATGNFNAHKLAYPDINWPEEADKFCAELGLVRSHYTTQIAHYDDIAALCHHWIRINDILKDFCRDIWTYISMEYFKQKVKEGEIGSSAMPHKVNPIDFENAEGNIGMANAVFEFLARKLPVSRLQRDLTDSTVLRNIGVPFGHTLIAMKSIIKGINKLLLNEPKLSADLDDNWAVVAEAIQTILRREQYPEPYEVLKALTRGKEGINKENIHSFIAGLNVSDHIKDELLAITPHNYIGYE